MRDLPSDPIPTAVTRLKGERRDDAEDLVAVEEPLSVQLEDSQWLVTLRTPGDDLDLVMGLLWSDGVMRAIDDADVWAAAEHTVRVHPAPGRALHREAAERSGTVSSACGMCGRHAIDEVRRGIEPVDDPISLRPRVLHAMISSLREFQGAFALTGGTHAAGLFDADGALLSAREDVGRHNAVDKVLGAQIRSARSRGLGGRLTLRGCVLVVTGRAGFEIVQKAARASVPVVCAVSAPTSLAVALAREVGVTLAAFARDDRMNLYAHPERVR